MPDRLLLRLAPDGDLSWLRQRADGRVASAVVRGAPPAAALAEAGEVVALVPAEDVLLLEARVAARNRAQLLKALPYAVEDQVLGAVEDLHFAATPMAAGETVGVAVVARERLSEWQARLGAAGVRADVLLPETLALPPGQALVDGARVLVRLAPWSAFACDADQRDDWLAQAQAAGLAPPARIEAGDDDALSLLAAGLGAPSLNLLDGEFAASHRQARGLRWWRRAAVLAALALGLAFALRGAETWRLSRAIGQVDAASRATLQAAFPELGAAELERASPEALMRGRLDRLRGGSAGGGLMALLGRIAPTLGSTTRIELRGLEYRNGVLELGLRAPDVAALDQMRERLAATPGLRVEVTAANPVENGVDGRLRIAGAGP